MIAILLFYLNWKLGAGFVILSFVCGIVGYFIIKKSDDSPFTHSASWEKDKISGKFIPIILYGQKRKKKIFSLSDIYCNSPDEAINEAYNLARALNMPDMFRRRQEI